MSQGNEPSTRSARAADRDLQSSSPSKRPAAHVSGIPLLKDEEVLLDERPAWSAWGTHLTLAALVALGGVLTGQLLAGVVLAALVVGYVGYRWRTTRYLVTDRRIVVLEGRSGTSARETWLTDVRGMRTGASPLERLFGHGHVVLSRTVDPDADRSEGVTLGGIPNYERIAAIVRRRRAGRRSGDS